MLTALAIAATLVVALLAVPLTLTFQFTWPQTAANAATLGWAFGLVNVDLSERRQAAAGKPDVAPEATATADKPDARRPRTTLTSSRGSRVVAALSHRPFRRRLLRLVGDVWRAARKDNFHLHATLGLDDPADTGRLWALLGPLSAVLASRRGAALCLVPEFTRASAEVDSAGRVRVVPLRVVAIAVGLLLSPTWWQGINRLRGAS